MFWFVYKYLHLFPISGPCWITLLAALMLNPAANLDRVGWSPTYQVSEVAISGCAFKRKLEGVGKQSITFLWQKAIRSFVCEKGALV